MLSLSLRKSLTLLAVLAALLAFDRAIAPADVRRSELAGLRHQARSLQTSRHADVLVIGSSTIGEWLTPKVLGSILNVPPKTIMNAHLSACYPSCSYSVVEQLKARGRQFRKVFLGVNLFSMCEGGPGLRVMQNVELTPATKLPEVFTTYFHSTRPATYLGTAAGMLLSHAYRDTTYQQDRLALTALGKGSQPELWRSLPPITPIKANKGRFTASCGYSPEKVALQTQFLARQLDSLSQIADQIYVLSLPQRSFARLNKDPEVRRAWRQYQRSLEELVSKHQKVALVDMTTDRVRATRYFRDAIHLNEIGMRLQSKHLSRLLRAKKRQLR